MIANHGNEAVVAALEHLLAHARQGKAGYLIATMVTDSEKPTGGWFGSPTLEPAAMIALEEMAGMMEHMVVNKTLPPRAADIPADRVCYNVPASPLSFDFIHWLVDAEMTRMQEGAPAPLKVGFWFGRDRESGLTMPSRRQMLDNVMRPALALIGAVEDPSAVDGRCRMEFGFNKVVERARLGLEVPRFRAVGPNPVRSADYVTITLREATQWTHRNSNMEAWIKFAGYLESRGERVIFVRDTAQARNKLGSLQFCPEASLDLHARAALYRSAKMNLFVSNGPATLAFFSDWPWMMFIKMERDGHPYTPNTPSFWRKEFGTEEGTQFPWCRPDQRIVWASDDYENLVAAWEEMQVPA